MIEPKFTIPPMPEKKTDGRRYAYEEYVRDMDKWYWERTQRLVKEKCEELSDKMTTSIWKSVAISAGMAVIASVLIELLFQLRKFQ